MKLFVKQLTMELFQNRIFLFLLLALTIFTSSLFYFVNFSIDGNWRLLPSISHLSENQLLYRNALLSNRILARNMLMALTGLTGFVFLMFYGKIFKEGSREIGCLKALGFQDSSFLLFFMAATLCISILGTFGGLIAGYFASGFLLRAGAEAYELTGLVKGLTAGNGAIGFFFPSAIYLLAAFFSYFIIRGKEIGILLSGSAHKSGHSAGLQFAEKAASLLPVKNKLSIRLILRKPVSVMLMLLSVLIFTVMFLLGYSLTLSSQRIFTSQTMGRHYLYDTHLTTPLCGGTPLCGDSPQRWSFPTADALPYLEVKGSLGLGEKEVSQTFVGFDTMSSLFSLTDSKGEKCRLPGENEIVIGPAQQELFGLDIGSAVTVKIKNASYPMRVSGIAFNAELHSVYLSGNQLSRMLSQPPGSYNGILSKESFALQAIPVPYSITTYAEKIEGLRRDSVSNRSSALINQGIGCIAGCILLFLALLLNLQDSKRDMLILKLMGWGQKEIRKLLMDIYRPILCLFFFLTLLPAIAIVKAVLQSLSLQIGDYMPFGTNLFVIAGIFLLLNALYFMVMAVFHLGIRKILKNDTLLETASMSFS